MKSVNELNNLREFYKSGATKSFEFRKQQLIKLKHVVTKYEKEIFKALYTDLRKSPEECWVTENGMLLTEINYALSNLHKWMSPQRVKTNLLNFPSSSYIVKEPLGVVLIISPWNYPLQLLLKPLVGAIAAGNCIVLKSSEFAVATTILLSKMIEETFDKKYILFTEGDGAEVVSSMMNQFVFDHVFFTGSTSVGKSVYQLAANNLVPVTLELGGKSPCIIESDADLSVAAKRIVSTKFSNAGQMCVAPDYVLIHVSIKQKFIDILISTIVQFFSSNAETAEHYGRIINEKQFDRIVKYLNNGTIVFGGNVNRKELFIGPTLMDNIDLESDIMQEEIFGPILPLIGFDKIEDAINIIEKNKNPLATYIFTSSNKKEKKWIENIAFGGGCVNNATWHLTNHHLPFGGRGYSGIGQYQGKYTFDTFSHKKSILKTPTWFDPSIKYPPYKGKLNYFKKFIR